MNVGEWKLVPYNCQDGECLMIWHTGRDHKLGALSPSHRSIGEAIVEELNRLENKNAEINYYIETVEEANDTLKTIRNNFKKENNKLKKENNKIIEIIDDKIKKIEDNLSLNQTGERKDYNWNVILAGMGMIDLLNNIKREYEEYLNE